MSDLRKTLGLLLHIDRAGITPMSKALILIHLAIVEKSNAAEIAKKIEYASRSVGRPLCEMRSEGLISSIENKNHKLNIKLFFLLSDKARRTIFDPSALSLGDLIDSINFMIDLKKCGIMSVKQAILMISIIIRPGIGNDKLSNLMSVSIDSIWGVLKAMRRNDLIEIKHVKDPKSGLKRPYYSLNERGVKLFQNVTQNQ